MYIIIVIVTVTVTVTLTVTATAIATITHHPSSIRHHHQFSLVYTGLHYSLYRDGSSLTEMWVRPSAGQSLSITFVQVFLWSPHHDLLRGWVPRLSPAHHHYVLSMAVPSESACAKYLCQIVKLHPLLEISLTGLVRMATPHIRRIIAHWVVALHAMQIT